MYGYGWCYVWVCSKKFYESQKRIFVFLLVWLVIIMSELIYSTLIDIVFGFLGFMLIACSFVIALLIKEIKKNDK